VTAILATSPALSGAGLPAVIYLRLSDFRDQTDDTFEVRRDELIEFAVGLGLRVVGVVIENDLNASGRPRGASAYKTPVKIRTAAGLIEFRTDRPGFQSVVRDYLLAGVAKVLIVSDDTRITRNERDGLDLIDAAQVTGASVVVPDDDGTTPRYVLTEGGSPSEVDRFRDRIGDARRYSAGIARNVAKGRRRWAGKSYHGGRRPFGYRVVEGTAEHARTLEVIEAERVVILRAAHDLLHAVTLAAVLRWIRDESGVPTVTGAPWSTRTIRDMLLKAAVTGQQVRAGQRVDAPWDAILDTPTQDRLRELLTDPARRTNKGGNEPRWLVSLFGECGVCHKPVKVGGAGRGRSPAYVGAECGHVRRTAPAVDALIGDLIVARLEEDDAADLLRPAPAPVVNAEALRAERAKLRRQRMALLDAFEGDPEAEGLIRAKDRRLAEIEVQLTATAEPDPLEEFRGQPARAVWEGLSIARRRAVVQLLLDQVVIERSGRSGREFNPDLIGVHWNPAVRAA
jgi:site-specific DNA recombinase